MEELQAIIGVVRTIVSAVFRSGVITDAEHAALHASLDGADPAVAEAKHKAETELSEAESAELERLLAKQKASEAGQPAAAAVPGGGFAQPNPVVPG